MSFLKEVFSEPGGSPSFGRVAFGFVILVTMAGIVFEIVRAGLKPDLGEWALFIAAVGGVTYTTNKISYAWGANKVESTKDVVPPAAQ